MVLSGCHKVANIQLLQHRPIDKRERKLERKGPVWRAPLVIDVLRNLPFLRHVPARAVEVRRSHSVGLGFRAQGWSFTCCAIWPFCAMFSCALWRSAQSQAMRTLLAARY